MGGSTSSEETSVTLGGGSLPATAAVRAWPPTGTGASVSESEGLSTPSWAMRMRDSAIDSSSLPNKLVSMSSSALLVPSSSSWVGEPSSPNAGLCTSATRSSSMTTTSGVIVGDPPTDISATGDGGGASLNMLKPELSPPAGAAAPADAAAAEADALAALTGVESPRELPPLGGCASCAAGKSSKCASNSAFQGTMGSMGGSAASCTSLNCTHVPTDGSLRKFLPPLSSARPLLLDPTFRS